MYFQILQADRVLTISVHFIDHVLQLCLCGVLTQRAHHCPQFFGGDGAIPILVKERKRLLEFWRGGKIDAFKKIQCLKLNMHNKFGKTV